MIMGNGGIQKIIQHKKKRGYINRYKKNIIIKYKGAPRRILRVAVVHRLNSNRIR